MLENWGFDLDFLLVVRFLRDGFAVFILKKMSLGMLRMEDFWMSLGLPSIG
jgi:hypothetical protein